MMDEKKGWLEKVLNDASAEVKSWPNWLKDREVGDQGDKKEARRTGASANANDQSGKNQQSLD